MEIEPYISENRRSRQERTPAGVGMKKYIMKGLLPLRVLLYRKNVIKVCSECEEIINFGKYFGSGWKVKRRFAYENIRILIHKNENISVKFLKQIECE